MNTPMENLINLLNLKLTGIVAVVKTSDGYYIGRMPGDIGYNAFFGRPAAVHPGPGLTHTLAVWSNLSPGEQYAVRHLAAHMPDGEPIDLRDFGLLTTP